MDTKTPQPGWAQTDMMDIFSSVETSAQGALDKVGGRASDVVAVGITNQRESLCVWDRNTGEPLHDAILWLDTRNRDTVASLESSLGSSDALRDICGLPVSTYFTGVKLRWMLDNVESVRTAVKEGRALIGTIDSWLIWKLSGGERHATDVTNASRTMLMNLQSGAWDESAAEQLGVSAAMSALPEITSSAEHFGTVSKEYALGGVPITGCIGDQQSAMVGQRCFGPGDAKTTFGTGAFTLMNTGDEPCSSEHGLLTTALYQMGRDSKIQYALEGSVGSCAVGLNWLCDSLGLFENAPEISDLASKVPLGADGVYFVSAFGGLFAPHWRDDARGTLVGLTLAHKREHVARAALEGIAFQVKDVVDSMIADSGVPLSSMRVDGGVSQSNPLLQSQADLLGASVWRPRNVETTALGAALTAAIGAGTHTLDDVSVVGDSEDGGTTFEPSVDAAVRERAHGNWKRAVASSLDWADRSL
eukprot:g2374.t1